VSEVGDDGVVLRFDRGTLLLEGVPEEAVPDPFVFDDRVALHRAPADRYRRVYAELFRRYGDAIVDEARGYREATFTLRGERTPYRHQTEALRAWSQAGRRGLVVLPTGSGKTFVAEMAIAAVERSTLVVVPTLDLMNQWYARLLAAFRVDEVGLLGGGYHELLDLTVSTYDSFFIHAERIGNRFGLIVFDECHHLPSASYAQAARCCIAPFRLGLTATPEREGEGEEIYQDLVGPVVYRKAIKELAGRHLADYEVIQVAVDLSPEERETYEQNRGVYLGFLRRNGIRMGSRRGWGEFVMRSSISRSGRRAMLAYREQRRVALCCRAKLELLEVLLTRHADDRTLVFTNDNETAYRISEWFLIPVITHQTKVRERRRILEGIRAGRFRAIVTSKVLNEGVDIPTANIAVVMSGSGSVREHVQRLGRILRRAANKRARLYEVIASDTMESYVSERRREHDAYR
jgi:superfamily II DNA or RNA helicase